MCPNGIVVRLLLSAFWAKALTSLCRMYGDNEFIIFSTIFIRIDLNILDVEEMIIKLCWVWLYSLFLRKN
jgi:hypothetical protein